MTAKIACHRRPKTAAAPHRLLLGRRLGYSTRRAKSLHRNRAIDDRVYLRARWSGAPRVVIAGAAATSRGRRFGADVSTVGAKSKSGRLSLPVGGAVRLAFLWCRRCVPPWEINYIPIDHPPWNAINAGEERTLPVPGLAVPASSGTYTARPRALMFTQRDPRILRPKFQGAAPADRLKIGQKTENVGFRFPILHHQRPEPSKS